MTDPRDLRRVVEIAVEAERAGVDGVMVGEHVVAGPNSGRNGVPVNPRAWLRMGTQPPDCPHPSALHLLSAMAAATTHIRLLAGAMLTPLRHALLVAKELATVDLISRGRLTVMPSVSWQEEEYDALGVPFHQRGRILDEQLEIWERLWRNGSPVSYEGQHFRFSNIYVEPQPCRKTGPPLWFAGNGVKPWLLRRAVRYGSGYLPVPPLTAEQMNVLREAMTQAGRGMDDFEIGSVLMGQPFKGADDVLDLDEALRPVPELYESGVSIFVAKPSVFIDDGAQVEDFCRELVRKVETLTT